MLEAHITPTSVSLQVQVIIEGRRVRPPRMWTPGLAGAVWRTGTGLELESVQGTSSSAG